MTQMSSKDRGRQYNYRCDAYHQGTGGTFTSDWFAGKQAQTVADSAARYHDEQIHGIVSEAGWQLIPSSFYVVSRLGPPRKPLCGQCTKPAGHVRRDSATGILFYRCTAHLEACTGQRPAYCDCVDAHLPGCANDRPGGLPPLRGEDELEPAGPLPAGQPDLYGAGPGQIFGQVPLW